MSSFASLRQNIIPSLLLVFSCLFIKKYYRTNLGNQSRGGAWFVFPVRWQNALGLVVAGQTVDTRLDQNNTAFTILALASSFQMLADGDSLLDHVVKIVGNVGFQTNRFHDAQNFVAIDKAHLCNTMGITKNDTNFRGVHTLLANFLICSLTSSALSFSHEGTVLL